MNDKTEEYQKVCDQAGVIYGDIQYIPGVPDEDQLVLFTDLITKSTLALKKKDFTSAKVQGRITVHRQKYPKDIEMTAYMIDAIDFIVKKYHVVPKSVITEAANNAALTIQRHINEGKN